MKSKQFTVVLALFALLIIAASLGGTWQTSFAQGTVPNEPPTRPVIIPVTGACTGVEFKKTNVATLCVPEGAVDKKYKVNFDIMRKFPGADQITKLTPVLSISLSSGGVSISEYTFIKPAVLTLNLTPAVVKIFKMNDKIALMEYNSKAGKWEKLPTKLDGNQMSITIPTTGMFVLAIPKP